MSVNSAHPYAAWLVHAYTATGAVLAFAATVATFHGRFRDAFLLLIVTTCWGWVVIAAVLLSSGYGFASLDAKTSDYFFTGFPSYWNIVALYLHAARTPPAFNGVLLLALVVMVFVRIGYVYPSRTPVLRGLTNALGAIWAVMMLAAAWLLPDAPRPLLIGSLFFPVYYTVLSFWLHAQRR
jgi:phosphatidylcholine synthase